MERFDRVYKMIDFPIKLVKETISHRELDLLCDWLKTYPQLTKGELTVKLESLWSEWLGVKYSVFLNSGSSANLAMLYSLKVSNKLKNNKIIFPCVSWVTTISPAIQLGLEPILCDTDKDSLGLDIEHLRELCEEHDPACIMLVHVLGFPNKMEEIQSLCSEYDIILLEDSCESVGSLYNGKKTGCFGLMSSFSTYFGHHFSTVEGGFVSTDNFELYEILKSIRSHGWSRDLSEQTKQNLKSKYSIDDFKNLYTFYYPGFNLRATDIQAFLGIEQLKTLDSKNAKRYQNLITYNLLIKNNYWKIKYDTFISNFSYPVIHPKISNVIKLLQENKVECRPLICGSMSRQPFYYEKYGKESYEFSDIIHDFGIYLPNNPDMSLEEIEFVCDLVNKGLAQ